MKSASQRGINSAGPSEIHRSQLTWLLWTLPVLICAVCSSCQKSLLQNVSEAPVVTAFKETHKASPEIPPELEGLHVYLSQDLWIINHHWSAYDEWTTLRGLKATSRLSSPQIHRWLFGVKQENSPLSESKNSSAVTGDDSSPTQVASSATASDSSKTADAGQPGPAKTKSSAEHWSFNALQEFFTRHNTENEPRFASKKIAALQQLSEHDTLAGRNAAILWATLAPQTAMETVPILEQLACDSGSQSASESKSEQKNKSTVSPAMRSAALNGLSLVLAHADALPLATKNRLTQLLARPDISVKLRGELYRSLSRFMPPAQIPSLDQSLDITDSSTLPPKELRQAALEGCIMHGLWLYAEPEQFSHLTQNQRQPRPFQTSVWPTNLMQVRWDPDATIRWNFGYWAAVVQHPDAEAILASQLKDADVMVQNRAIQHLGLLASDSALQLLKEQAKRPQETVRVSAATGLSSWGPSYLKGLKDDSSSAVRHAVAAGLGLSPTADAALQLKSLINDRSTEVQLTVIESIQNWPDELAVPLLLEGIQEGVFKTRRSSVLQLTERTGVGGTISIEASRDERIAAIRSLVQSGELPGGFWTQLMQEGIRQRPRVNQGRRAELQAYFQNLISQPMESPARQQAFQELSHLTPEEVNILEKMILDTSIAIPEEIYSDLLPKLDASYAALQQLTSSHITDRRQAAQQLFRNSQKSSLNPVIVKRLRKLMTQEQDRLVWRIVMESIAQDNYEETAQLALLAINHHWPDIRVLGCDYFGAHGLPRYAPWILPLLNDKNRSVQLAAIKALGHCHNPLAINGVQSAEQTQSTPASLRALMTDSNQRVRFQTVVALSHLGDFQGMQELVRISNDPRSSVRRDAVREMGESGQTRFVEPLIQMAWTERNTSTLEEMLSSLDRLVPESDQPPELKTESRQTEQAKIWMNWWQTQHSGAGSRLFTGR
ncbi:HEAT repeat protein [Gimesia panareensis]|uniref:HEAT repeat protein n=1 Tax=Gimesia panareensis TaxID=2527978 RepID=A0A517Q8U4_9PLAN|nr:HEAT repeat protein [Gimesia panareensis]